VAAEADESEGKNHEGNDEQTDYFEAVPTALTRQQFHLAIFGSQGIRTSWRARHSFILRRDAMGTVRFVSARMQAEKGISPCIVFYSISPLPGL
jgi:hypothetical protein